MDIEEGVEKATLEFVLRRKVTAVGFDPGTSRMAVAVYAILSMIKDQCEGKMEGDDVEEGGTKEETVGADL